MSEDLFELNENGEVVYNGTIDDPENLFGVESEGENDAEHVDSVADSGNLIADEIQDSEDLETSDTETSVDLEESDTSDSPLLVVLSDDVTTALLDASTPAGGALASSTLDYFDRVIGSLPSGYVYVAYRTDTDYSYNGVLYYGKDYTVKDDVVTFGDDARQVRVERTTSSSYSTYTTYKEYSASDVVVNLSRSGDVVYYSNAYAGFPILGGYDKPIGLSTYLCVGLVVAFAVAVLSKVIKR